VAWESIEPTAILNSIPTKINLPGSLPNSSLSTQFVKNPEDSSGVDMTRFEANWWTGNNVTYAMMQPYTVMYHDTYNWEIIKEDDCNYRVQLKPLLLTAIKGFKTRAGTTVWNATQGDGKYLLKATLYIFNTFAFQTSDWTTPDWRTSTYTFKIEIAYQTAVTATSSFVVYRVRNIQDTIDSQGHLRSILELVSPSAFMLRNCAILVDADFGVNIVSQEVEHYTYLTVTSKERKEEFQGLIVVQCDQNDCQASSEGVTSSECEDDPTCDLDCNTLALNQGAPYARFNFTYDQGGWSGSVAGDLEITTQFYTGTRNAPFTSKMTGGVTGQSFIGYTMCIPGSSASLTTFDVTFMKIGKPRANKPDYILKLAANKKVTGFGRLQTTTLYGTAYMANTAKISDVACVGVAFDPRFMITSGGKYNLEVGIDLASSSKKKATQPTQAVSVNVQVDTSTDNPPVVQKEESVDTLISDLGLDSSGSPLSASGVSFTVLLIALCALFL